MAETKNKTTKKTVSKKTQVAKPTTTSKKSTTNTTRKKLNNTPKTVKTTKITQSEKKVTNLNNKEQETNTLLTALGIIVLVIVAIVIFRVTYAYFTATINKTGAVDEDIVVKTADLLVRYEDGESNMKIGDKIEPGNIITKKFSVVNDGSDTGQFTIVLQNIKHNLGHKVSEEDEKLISDVKFTLSKVEEDGSKTVIGTGLLPFEEQEYIIYTVDEVDYKDTNYYLLEVEYLDQPKIDQSDSMGESLELKINIINYEGEQRTQDTEY